MLSYSMGFLLVGFFFYYLCVHKVCLSSLGYMIGTSICYFTLGAETVDFMIGELQ